MVSEVSKWYLRARRKYVWDIKTISAYVKVLQWIVDDLLAGRGVTLARPLSNPLHQIKVYVPIVNANMAEQVDHLVSSDIGLIPVHSQESQLFGYALYISDYRLLGDKRRSLFGCFKSMYQMYLNDPEFESFVQLGATMDVNGHTNNRAQAILALQKECAEAKLIKDFRALANKSLNHERSISLRDRYQVLQRDNFTCQSCGRHAPEVRLHVDHIRPVSWESDLKASNSIEDYQTLCEDCNLGKGDLSWLLSEL